MEQIQTVNAATQEVAHTKVVSPLQAEKVYTAQYQKPGTVSVQLRQEVNTTDSYPSQKANNPNTANLFSLEEFGFPSEVYSNTEKRVGWVNVPTGTTIEQVAARIASLGDKAVLYRVLDNKPIINGDQLYSISIGQKTMDEFANSQVIRYSANHATKAGKIVLDKNGKVQYRAVFFDDKGMQDADGRNANPDHQYMSPEIKAELEGAPISAIIVPAQGLMG